MVRAVRVCLGEEGEGDSSQLEVKRLHSLQIVIPHSPLVVEVRVKMQNESLSRHLLL